jgi:hypothetical protein
LNLIRFHPVLGFDITRSPHPKAFALFSPLISGGVFLIGVAYFRPDVVTKILAYPGSDNALKTAVALILSYSAGLLLSLVLAGPFIIFVYLSGLTSGYLVVYVKRRRSNSLKDPSKQPPFRRIVQVVFGPSLIPRTPEENSRDFPDRLLAALTPSTGAPSDGEISNQIDQAREALRLEAFKIFAADHEQQWEQLHKALYQVEARRSNPVEALICSIEPTLSVAASVFVWRWLSFTVPAPIYVAGIVSFVVIGGMLFVHGLARGPDYIDAISLQAFLLEELLDRNRSAKSS